MLSTSLKKKNNKKNEINEVVSEIRINIIPSYYTINIFCKYSSLRVKLIILLNRIDNSNVEL